jgi:hypothetical protein
VAFTTKLLGWLRGELHHFLGRYLGAGMLPRMKSLRTLSFTDHTHPVVEDFVRCLPGALEEVRVEWPLYQEQTAPEWWVERLAPLGAKRIELVHEGWRVFLQGTSAVLKPTKRRHSGDLRDALRWMANLQVSDLAIRLGTRQDPFQKDSLAHIVAGQWPRATLKFTRF